MKNIRLETIADMVQEGMVVADIGTDHALLPILLVQSGKTNKVYACDIAEGPLSSAKENIEKHSMSDSIFPILSDGFEHVPLDAQIVVIAGMGYLSAKGILERNMDRLSSFQQIIAEINRDPHEMRRWISENHFTITDESYVHERKHDYEIISFTTKQHIPYTDMQIELGPVLMEKQEEGYLQYCQFMQEKLDSIIQKSHGQAPNIEELIQRKNFYENYLQDIKKA